VFAAFLGIYLLVAAGHVETIDVSESIAVSQQIVNHGVLWVTGFPTTPGGGVVPGVGGHLFSPHDIGLALIFTPISLLLRWTGLSPQLGGFLYTLVDAVFSALLVAVFFRFSVGLTNRLRPSLWAAAVLGLCTIVFPYAHTTFDAMPTAFFLLLSVYATWTAAKRTSTRYLLAGGCAAGAAVLIRSDSLILIAPLAFWVIWRFGVRHISRHFTGLLAWFTPLVIAALVTGWYDVARFGSWLNNGHAHDPQTKTSSHLWYGLAGGLVSPGKGLVFFAPPVVIALLGWRRFIRDEPGLSATIVVGAGAYLIFVSRLINWSGAEAWGPRFLVPITALLLLPLAGYFARWDRLAWYVQMLCILVCSCGLAIQVAGISVWEAAIDRVHGGRLQLTAFHSSEILYAWQAAWRGIHSHPPYPSTLQGGIVPPPVPHLDFWWLGGFGSTSHHAVPAKIVAGALAVATLAIVGCLYRRLTKRVAIRS
jgi:hypothetical protein